MTHVKQELKTIPGHMSSPPGFSWVRVARSLVFYVMFCTFAVCPFLLDNVLSFRLRFTSSDWLLQHFCTLTYKLKYRNSTLIAVLHVSHSSGFNNENNISAEL